MDDIEQKSAPAGWAEALDRAEADLAAGRVYPGDEVRKRLRDSIERMRSALEIGATSDR